MTSAIDELSRILDERGVLHGYVEHDCVWWEGEGDGVAYEALEVYVLDEPSGYFDVRDLTPQQAIDATLGRGTCENTEQLPLAWSFTCSECGVHSITEGERFSYCPNCGRRCVR